MHIFSQIGKQNIKTCHLLHSKYVNDILNVLSLFLGTENANTINSPDFMEHRTMNIDN